MQPKILVTGATGFVGRYLVRELLSRYYQVRCFVKNNESYVILNGLDVEITSGDIRDKDSVIKAAADVHVFINLASVLGIPDPEINYAVNVEGAKNIVAACTKHNVKRLISFSSISASRKRTSAYGLSKKEAEDILLSAGLNTTILRTEMIYGNGSRGLQKIIKQVTSYPLFIPLVGRGVIMRQPVYVRDIVRLTVDLIDNPLAYNRLLDVGGKDRVQLRYFVLLIARHLGIRKRIFPVPKIMALGIAYILEIIYKIPPFTVDNMIGLTVSTNLNLAPIFNEFNFHPISLEEGISRSIQEMEKCTF